MTIDSSIFDTSADERRTDVHDRGAGSLEWAICSGPLAEHEIGDHDSRIMEGMLELGFPTPVAWSFPRSTS